MATTLSAPALQVLEGVELTGAMNTPDETLLRQVASSIRRGHQQVCRQAVKPDVVALVGSGPSLKDTEEELVAAIWAGAKLVTVNGAYRWCIERHLKPGGQIVMDARPTNARFLDPAVPDCRYWLASQCHPDTWDRVAGREHVGIFHDAGVEGVQAMLDAYYLKNWMGVAGGTTVGTRAIGLLRTLGYVRFECFGMDSCWIDGQHHAFDQPENVRDKSLIIRAHPTGHPERGRAFVCSPWHLKQAEDLLQFIRAAGQHFKLRFHGDGLLAYILRSSADVQLTEEGVI